MLEVGKSYRTVDGRNTGPLKSDWPARFRATEIFIPGSVPRIGQAYNDDGSVYMKRPGEENDRIVGEWSEVIVGKTYYGSTGEVKVEAIANDWVFYSYGGDLAGTLRTEAFLAAYQPKRPTKTVWVNLWWNSTSGSIHMGQMHASEAEADRSGDRNGLLATISLEIPA